MAEMAAVKAPQALPDLYTLTEKNVDEEKISTRLGVDSVGVVCCFVDPDGRRWLDRERTRAVPETGAGENGRFTVDQVKAVLGESIPLRQGDWCHQDREVTAPPPAWRDNASLRDLLLLPHPVAVDGTVGAVEVGGRRFLLHPTLGLTG
jgi:CRISPR-associated endonuclease/helicase Cas3